MTSVTVATINVHGHHDRWRERRHLLVAQILDNLPDIIALQELSLFRGQGRWLRSQINMRSGGSRRQPYRLAQQRRTDGSFLTGVGLLSRLPVLSHDGLALGHGSVALRANILLPSGHSIDFVTTRLRHGAMLQQTRHEQVMRLAGWLKGTGSVPLQIVAGDFNETPDGPAVQQMRQGYRSVFTVRYGREPLATFPTALVPSDGWAGCLDYIFISRGIGVSEARLFCRRPASADNTLFPSDHVGLLATLEIDER